MRGGWSRRSTLHWSVLVTRELSRQSAFLPSPPVLKSWWWPKWWSWGQAAEMSFHHSLAGHSLKDKVRISVIRRGSEWSRFSSTSTGVSWGDMDILLAGLGAPQGSWRRCLVRGKSGSLFWDRRPRIQVPNKGEHDNNVIVHNASSIVYNNGNIKVGNIKVWGFLFHGISEEISFHWRIIGDFEDESGIKKIKPLEGFSPSRKII